MFQDHVDVFWLDSDILITIFILKAVAVVLAQESAADLVNDNAANFPKNPQASIPKKRRTNNLESKMIALRWKM